MSKNLITLLGGDVSAELALKDLQLMTRDSSDVRLIADILHKAHLVMRQLGLDPSDTTPEEVYNALLNAVRTEQWLSLLAETDYVLADVNGEVISFNPIDVINNFHFQLPIEKRQTKAAKKGLGWEITKRYRSHPVADQKRVDKIVQRANLPLEEPQFCRVVFDKPSILAIGDVASEAQISIDSSRAEITGSKNARKISLDLGARIACQGGEVQDAAGAVANVSVAMSKQGVQVSLMSWLGGDTAGKQSLNYLRQHGIDMSGVIIDEHVRSNYHYVLRHGAERTILASYENFHYQWQDPTCQPDWVFLSTISGDSWELHESLLGFLSKNPKVKLAFQPGAVHLNWGVEKLKDVYARSEVVIMNVDEAMMVTGRQARNVTALLQAISRLGVNKVVLTDGPKGAFVFDGEKAFEVPSYPDPSDPVDRTGAGDAFAATLIAELSKGKDLKDAFLRAPINSMSVVQQAGSQSGLLSAKDIEEYLNRAPSEYAIKPLLV